MSETHRITVRRERKRTLAAHYRRVADLVEALEAVGYRVSTSEAEAGLVVEATWQPPVGPAAPIARTG